MNEQSSNYLLFQFVFSIEENR